MICPSCKSHYSSICLKCGYDPKTEEAKFTPKELGMSELPHVPMEKSHIWLGRFASEASLDEYFDESMIDDDETPMNRFAGDQGEVFYNHDWVERGFDDSGDLQRLIAGHSYADDYRDEVAALAREGEMTGVNTFILADADEFGAPRSVETQEYRLWYLGKFTCNV